MSSRAEAIKSATGTHTRGVLGGAYRGKSADLKSCLTHLVYMKGEFDTLAVGCPVKLDHIVDFYSDPEGHDARPTCQKCAKKWDKLYSAK